MYAPGVHWSTSPCKIPIFMDSPAFEPKNIKKYFEPYFIDYIIDRTVRRKTYFLNIC